MIKNLYKNDLGYMIGTVYSTVLGYEIEVMYTKDISLNYVEKNVEYFNKLDSANDMKTMLMIPFDINNYFGHLGGVGEINLLQRKASKGTWKMFPNWKK